MHHSLRLGVFFLALTLAGCPLEGNGDRTIEQRDLSDFTQVDNDSPLEVSVEQGDTFSVSVAIDSNLIERVKTKVSGDTLEISTHDLAGFGMVKGPHVRITMPLVTGLRVSGAGDLDAFNFEDADSVRLSVSGAGDMAWDGTAAELTASVTGAGDLVLDGATDHLDLRVSGAGDAKARGCTAGAAEVDVSGAGDASVTVEGDLDVTVSGAGDVDIFGDPHITHRSHSGAGDLHVH